QFRRKVAAGLLAVCRLGAHVEDLPPQRLPLEQLAAGELGEVAGVVALVVPAAVGRVAVGPLRDQDWRAPPRPEQEGDARGVCGAAAAGRAATPRAVLVLDGDEVLTAQAIPVVFAEEALARQPARALDAVQGVERVADVLVAEGAVVDRRRDAVAQ